MTPQGDIAIVETKLFRNPEARRRIVAQATWREVVDFPQPRSQEVRASFAAQSLRTIHLWLQDNGRPDLVTLFLFRLGR